MLVAGVNALVTDGAKTLVFTTGNVGLLPETVLYPSSQVAVGAAYSTAYNGQMQTALAAVAKSGVRVEYLDLSQLASQIAVNPALYGLKSAGSCGLGNFAFCLTTAGQTQYLFYADGIHLTSAGFTIMGEYIANRLNAPATIASSGNMGLGVATSFAGNMFGRMDMFNAPAPSEGPGFMAYADTPSNKGPLATIPAPENRWSAYIQSTDGFGSRAGAGNAAGYNWSSWGGVVGLEYKLQSNWLIGGAIDLTNPTVKLGQGAGGSNMVASQLGLYSVWAGKNFFAEGVLSYGVLGYENSRPGVVSTINSSPTGQTFAAAFKTGYLYDVAPSLRLGPIAGLTYALAHLNSYSETGDPLLTLNVGSQNISALLGSAGAQARYAFDCHAIHFDTFLNATAEDNFSGNGRLVQFSATSAPIIVNSYQAQALPNHVFARVAGGVSWKFLGDFTSSTYISQTIGQPGGQDFTMASSMIWKF